MWYIPYHVVYHPKKPQQIRVVFDCSTCYKGHSLNNHLFQVPYLINGPVGILLLFRKETIWDCARHWGHVSPNLCQPRTLEPIVIPLVDWWQSGQLSTDLQNDISSVWCYSISSLSQLHSQTLCRRPCSNGQSRGDEIHTAWLLFWWRTQKHCTSARG